MDKKSLLGAYSHLQSVLQAPTGQNAPIDLLIQTLDHIEDGIFVFDSNCTVLLFNHAMEELCQVRAQDIVGRCIFESFPSLRENGEVRNFSDVLTGRPVTTQTIPICHSRHLGESFTSSYAPLVGDDGSIVGGFVRVRNRTEQKKLEERSKLTEQALKQILSGFPDLYFTLSYDGRYLAVNAGSSGNSELIQDAESLVGHYLSDFFSGEILSKILGALKRVKETQKPYEIEYSIRLPDKGEQFYIARVMPSLDQPKDKAFLVARNTTERMKLHIKNEFLLEAGALLGASLDFRKTILDLGKMITPRLADFSVISLLDESEKVIRSESFCLDPELDQIIKEIAARYYWDPAGKTIAATTIRTGQPIFNRHLDQERLQELTQDQFHFEKIRRAKVVSSISVPIKSRTRVYGALLVASTTSSKHYDDSDLALFEELAGRCAVAIENSRLYLKTAQAARSKDQVLTLLSHELSAPISSIDVDSNLLLKIGSAQGEDNKPIRKLAQNIRQAVEQIQSLVAEWVEVQNFSAEEFDLDKKPMEIARLVSEVEKEVGPLLRKKGQSLRINSALDHQTCLCDEKYVHEAICSLIANASLRSPEGAQVAVDTRLNHQMITLVVHDRGPPVPEIALPHIFDRSKSNDDSRPDLFMVKRIVEAHEGKVWVENQSQQGSSFYLTLPLFHFS